MAMTAGDPVALPQSIAEFTSALRAGDFTAVETTQCALDAAMASQTSINAFIVITQELALAQAALVDAALAAGRDPGPLVGVPVGVKDVFDLDGFPTTAGSRLFANNLARKSATAVDRLVEAGAVVIGKTNMDQFAFGPHQDDFGRTNCPADTDCYAGGSSGGSAAAVANGCVLAALGSDAGGSTRFPAACCGIVGFKGTFGRVPTDGVFPTFWSLDHVGEIARSVDDLRMFFSVLANPPNGQDVPLEGAPKIAVLREWQQGCTDGVLTAVEQALAVVNRAGANVIEGREIAALAGSLQTLITTVAPEAWEVLEPHLIDGVDAVPAGLLEILTAGRKQGAAEYVAAQRDRIALRRAVDEALSDVDALAMPTSLDVAWRWADIDVSEMGLRKESTRYLPVANLTGHPAISIPVPSDGLPVGLQLIGRIGQDERLLDVARWIEQSLRQ